MANLQLPSWAPYALAGVVGVLLIGSALSPDDDAPRTRQSTKAVRKAAVKASRAVTVDEKAKRAKATAEKRASVAAAKADASGTVTARRTSDAAERKVERIDEIQAKLDSGSYTPSELHDWMKSGTLRFRNPDGTVAEAVAQAERFHGGQGKYEVVELSESERQPLGKYAVVIGKLEELTYEPDGKSERGETLWTHQIGDRGPFAPKAKGKPLLVADPVTGRVHIVQHRAPLVFDPGVGLVG